MLTIRLRHRGRTWRSAVALSWSAAGAEPKAVTLTADGDRWTFDAAGRRVTFNWRDGRVEDLK